MAMLQYPSKSEDLIDTASARSEAPLVLTSAAVPLSIETIQYQICKYFCSHVYQTDAAIISTVSSITLLEDWEQH